VYGNVERRCFAGRKDLFESFLDPFNRPLNDLKGLIEVSIQDRERCCVAGSKERVGAVGERCGGNCRDEQELHDGRKVHGD
jgi:hypothetical protein